METSSAETGSSRTMNFGQRHQGAGDRDALALAAAELVRVERDGCRAGDRPAAGPRRRARAPWRGSRRRRWAAARRRCAPRASADPASCTDPGTRPAPRDGSARGRRDRRRRSPMPSKSSEPAVGRSRSRKEPGERGLAGARLAHDPQRLALGHLHAHPVERLDPVRGCRPIEKPDVAGSTSSARRPAASRAGRGPAGAAQQCAVAAVAASTAGGYSVVALRPVAPGSGARTDSRAAARARSGGCPPISTSCARLRATSGRQRKQRPRVGMARVVEDLQRRAHLHDPAGVHDRRPGRRWPPRCRSRA